MASLGVSSIGGCKSSNVNMSAYIGPTGDSVIDQIQSQGKHLDSFTSSCEQVPWSQPSKRSE